MTMIAGAQFNYTADLLAELPDIPPDSIVSRTLHNDERVRVILFGFAPGQELTEHTASVAAILHFLEGQASLTLGQEKQEAAAGTWTVMQPNLPHSIQAHTRVAMLLTMIKD